VQVVDYTFVVEHTAAVAVVNIALLAAACGLQAVAYSRPQALTVVPHSPYWASSRAFVVAYRTAVKDTKSAQPLKPIHPSYSSPSSHPHNH